MYCLFLKCFFFFYFGADFFLEGGGGGEVSNLRIDLGLAVKPIYNQVRFIYVKPRFAFGIF